MAKVVAPLQSFSASGKVGKSLVFFSHLGRNVVRGLVTPANPQTEGQGATRLLLGALGRIARVPFIGGPFITALKTVIASGQTWVSSFITYGMGQFGTPAALATAANAHTAASTFVSQANTLGIAPVTISYAGATTTLTGGQALYALASYASAINAQNPGIFGSSAPWDTALVSWDASDVQAFVADLVATS